ncbi:MAG: histidine phosphatase family protein [Ornithinimicrobium sp.]
MTTTRRVIVLRHGQTLHNVGGIYQGHLDTDLSSAGEHQAEAAAKALSAQPITRIVSSDLTRAARTAQALSRGACVPVDYDRRLREIDVGTWAGMKHNEVAARYPQETAAIAQGYDARRGGHGENLREVGLRTHSVFSEVVGMLHEGQLAVLVTHGLAARTLVSSVLGWSDRQTWLTMAGLGNCQWAELAQHRTGWRLVSWNAGALPGPVTRDQHVSTTH